MLHSVFRAFLTESSFSLYNLSSPLNDGTIFISTLLSGQSISLIDTCTSKACTTAVKYKYANAVLIRSVRSTGARWDIRHVQSRAVVANGSNRNIPTHNIHVTLDTVASSREVSHWVSLVKTSLLV